MAEISSACEPDLDLTLCFLGGEPSRLGLWDFTQGSRYAD